MNSTNILIVLVKSVSFRHMSINLDMLFSWFRLHCQDFYCNKMPGIVVFKPSILERRKYPGKIMGTLKKRDKEFFSSFTRDGHSFVQLLVILRLGQQIALKCMAAQLRICLCNTLLPFCGLLKFPFVHWYVRCLPRFTGLHVVI